MAKKEIAMLGAGCFWGVQYVFDKAPGVIKTEVGYAGGHMKNPSYEDVCSDETGHAEVLKIEYNPEKIKYEKLLEVFFKCHDPTQLNRQGPDFGSQYRSVIFYYNDEQKKTAERAKKDYEKEIRKKIMTTIEKAGEFYKAEDYHQKYYAKKNGVPYCHVIPDVKF